MTEHTPASADETIGQQFIDAAHEQAATPDQMAEAAAGMAAAALQEAKPEERAEVAERITRLIAPLVAEAGVKLEAVALSNKIARLKSLGIEVDEERIRKRLQRQRRPT